MSTPQNTPAPLRKNGPLAGLLAYCAFIMWASLRSGGGGVAIKHFDKVLHAGVYAVLAWLACWALPNAARWKIWLAVTLYGGFMEFCQGAFTQGRMPSLADGVANAFGAAVAVLLWHAWSSRRLARA